MDLSIEDEARYLYLETMNDMIRKLSRAQWKVKESINTILSSHFCKLDDISIDLVKKRINIGPQSNDAPCITHMMSIPEIRYLEDILIRISIGLSNSIDFDTLTNLIDVIKNVIINELVNVKPTKI